MLEKFAPYVIGFFILCIIAEAVYSRREKKGLYDKNDTFISVALGLIGAVTRILLKGGVLLMWGFFYSISPFKIETTVLSIAVLFLLNEFVYYWFHRWSHELPFFWATHINHHSSITLNFAVAVRTPFLNSIYHGLFWIPLPLLGFNPLDILAVEIFGFFFAFIPHTTIIPKLGILEYIFITPSNHRVHHACNPKYINKNYGNTLVIFDQLFGTWEKETEEPVYGLVKNPVDRNLVNMIFHGWKDYFASSRGAGKNNY